MREWRRPNNLYFSIHCVVLLASPLPWKRGTVEGELAQWVKVLGQTEFDPWDQHDGRRESNAKSGPPTLETLSAK